MKSGGSLRPVHRVDRSLSFLIKEKRHHLGKNITYLVEESGMVTVTAAVRLHHGEA